MTSVSYFDKLDCFFTSFAFSKWAFYIESNSVPTCWQLSFAFAEVAWVSFLLLGILSSYLSTSALGGSSDLRRDDLLQWWKIDIYLFLGWSIFWCCDCCTCGWWKGCNTLFFFILTSSSSPGFSLMADNSEFDCPFPKPILSVSELWFFTLTLLVSATFPEFWMIFGSVHWHGTSFLLRLWRFLWDRFIWYIQLERIVVTKLHSYKFKYSCNLRWERILDYSYFFIMILTTWWIVRNLIIWPWWFCHMLMLCMTFVWFLYLWWFRNTRIFTNSIIYSIKMTT